MAVLPLCRGYFLPHTISTVEIAQGLETRSAIKPQRPSLAMETHAVPSQGCSIHFMADQLSNGRHFQIIGILDIRVPKTGWLTVWPLPLRPSDRLKFRLHTLLSRDTWVNRCGHYNETRRPKILLSKTSMTNSETSVRVSTGSDLVRQPRAKLMPKTLGQDASGSSSPNLTKFARFVSALVKNPFLLP